MFMEVSSIQGCPCRGVPLLYTVVEFGDSLCIIKLEQVSVPICSILNCMHIVEFDSENNAEYKKSE